MNKTIVASLLILSLCLIFVGCTDRDKTNTTSPNESTVYTDTKSQEVSSTVDSSDDGLAGMKADKYRYNYYRITAPYIDIVGDKAYDEWVNSNPKYSSKNLMDEMLIVSYIKHFGITREQFDKASQKRLELFEEFNMEPNFPPYEYEEDYNYEKELYEVYNANIIFTFDNDIINEYYARPPELIVENGTNALGENVE